MRVAIIDLGTNSVRFDVHQIDPTSPARSVRPRSRGRARPRSKKLYQEKQLLFLGKGVFLHGRFDPLSVRDTLKAFSRFARLSRRLKVDRTIAYGTAALREAGDAESLLQKIERQTGIRVHVISGAREAQLIALGVLRNIRPPRGRFGLIDIGGGSTEISVCRGRNWIRGRSFALGTARLHEAFLHTSPPLRLSSSAPDPIESLRHQIRRTLRPIRVENWPQTPFLLGSSGTVRALIRLARKGKDPDGKTLSLRQLEKLVKVMSPLTRAKLLKLPGMEAKRADTILAGAVLLEEGMRATGARKIAFTEYSLRDGIWEEQLSKT